MIRFRSILTLLLLASVSVAQESPPVKLDTITLQQVLVIHRAQPVNAEKNIAYVYTSNGGGWILLDEENLPRIWRIKNADGSLKDYTWFRITEGNAQSGFTSQEWFCDPAVWDAYAISGDVAALKASSTRFDKYYTLHDYQLPTIEDPVLWEKRTDVLTVGYTPDNTLLVVKRNDTTGQWEWTIRGTKGISSWTVAADEASAKEAAASRLGELQ